MPLRVGVYPVYPPCGWCRLGGVGRAGARPSVLVVVTPCPLLLAVPIAIIAGVSRAAQYGVIIKGGAGDDLGSPRRSPRGCPLTSASVGLDQLALIQYDGTAVAVRLHTAQAYTGHLRHDDRGSHVLQEVGVLCLTHPELCMSS